MIRISDIGNLDRVQLHEHMSTPIFSRTQWFRVRKSRPYLKAAIRLCSSRPTIVELGCAALDISGRFSSVADVIGVDCNSGYVSIVEKRFPDCKLIIDAVETFTPEKVDILVLCEILEHLVDPMGLLKRLLPLTRYVIISHPVDERLTSNRSDNQHYWSFSEEDFDRWFYENNYRILQREAFFTFPKGGGFDHRIALGEKNVSYSSNFS